jgi:gas vesicle protein
MNNGKVLLAVLAAAAAGAALGMLFAPEKGSDTRKKIARTGEDIIDTVERSVDNMKSKIYGKKQAGELINAQKTV